jgi:hypothetical protein
MGFFKKLKGYKIDPDKYIALQYDFILYSRKNLEADVNLISLREYNERDQLLTRIETFVHRLARRRLKQKIQEISSLSSL